MDRDALLENALTQVAALTAQVAALTAELIAARRAAEEDRAALLAKIDALTAKIEALLAKKGKKPPPAAAPQPAPPQGPPPSLDDRPRPPEAPKKEPAPARRSRTPKPRAVLPVVEESVRPDACVHCGCSRLSNKETDEKLIADYVPGYIRYRKVAQISCRCGDCGKVTTPAIPGACLPKTHFTAAFAAFVIYTKFALHVPLERQLRDLARMGLRTSNAQLSDLVQRCLAELEGVADVIFRELMSGSHAHSDASGFPVLKRGQDKTHLGQMFTFCWGKRVAFRYAPDKKGATFASLVGPFRGTLVLDASSTHNAALSTGQIIWAGCNAHGLRKFRDAKENDPVLGAEGERWISSWFDQERLARDQGLTGPALLAWRDAKIRPLVNDFRKWLDLVHPTALPKSPMAEATRYYDNHWVALTAFLRDPLVPLDNNFAERSLRGHALGRKNWLFAGSDAAAGRTAVAQTLIQTAQLEGVDVLAYLTWLLERAAACRDGGGLYANLTPAAYKEAQERKAGG